MDYQYRSRQSIYCEVAKIAEGLALEKYGGYPYLKFYRGEPMLQGFQGCTVPDSTRIVKNHFEAIEVKFIDFEHSFVDLSSKASAIKKQLANRQFHLPEGSHQRLVVFYNGDFLGIEDELREGFEKRLLPYIANLHIDIYKYPYELEEI